MSIPFPRRLTRSGRLGRLLAGLAVLAAWAGAAPAGAGAQDTQRILAERRLEYRAARDSYEAASSAFSVLERQFSAALDQVSRARRSGDEDALERAFAAAQERSIPLRAQEDRVAEARQRLDEARRALIDVITVRLGELLSQFDQASSAAQRDSLDALWRDLNDELRTLEAEGGEGTALLPVVVPEITFDPRDGPVELEAKAGVLERLASAADTAILSVDQEIRRLNDRLRMERNRRDFVAGTDRFDDTRVPVVTGGPPGDAGQPADSTRAAGSAGTLEERIRALESYRETLESYRNQLLIRAEQFRRRVGRIT